MTYYYMVLAKLNHASLILSSFQVWKLHSLMPVPLHYYIHESLLAVRLYTLKLLERESGHSYFLLFLEVPDDIESHAETASCHCTASY